MVAGVILVLVVSLYRLLPWFLGWNEKQPDWFINVSPMAAVVLCGAAMLPRRWAIALPFAGLLGSSLLLNHHYHFALINAEFVVQVLAFGVIALFGWQFRKNARLRVLLPAAIGGSVFFYLASNTASWLYDPGYTKTLAGWTQAMTIGLPLYQPTWMFYRNTLISDMVFTLLFVVCARPLPRFTSTEKAAAAAW